MQPAIHGVQQTAVIVDASSYVGRADSAGHTQQFATDGNCGAAPHQLATFENALQPLRPTMELADDVNGDGVQRLPHPASSPQAVPERSSSPWSVDDSMEHMYEHLKFLGAGAFGNVYKARCRETGQVVAVKQIRVEEDGCVGEGIPASIIREVACLRGFVHPNIVRLLDVKTTSAHLYNFVFEFVDSDLSTMLKYHRTNHIEMAMPLVKKYTSELLSGTHACHCRLILHRDLKPQNILVGKDGLKIADFGLARLFAAPLVNYTPEVVTLWYRAPELLLGLESYGPEVDMWSVGVIIAEMAIGNYLFPGDCEIATLFKIFQLVGTPSESDWPGCSTLQHWNPQFPKWQGTGLSFIEAARPDLGQHGIELIRGLLRLSPQARLRSRRAKNSIFAQAKPDAAHTESSIN